MKHLSEEPVPPSVYAPGVPAGLEQVVLRALAEGRGRPLPDGRGDVGRPRPSASRRRAVAAYGADDARRAAASARIGDTRVQPPRDGTRVWDRELPPAAAAAAEGASAPRRAGRGSSCSCCCWRPARSPPSRSRASIGDRKTGTTPPTTVAVPSDLVGKDQVTAQNELSRLGLKASIRGLCLVAAAGQRPARRPVRRLRGQARLHGDAVRVDGPEARDRPRAQGDDRPAGDRRPERPRAEVRRRDRHERPRDRGHGDQAGSGRREHRAEGLVRRRDGLERPEAGAACRTCAARTSRPRRRTSQRRDCGSGTSTARRRRASRPGTIISTDPPGDTQQPQGSAVNLLFSSGIPKVPMPNVVGRRRRTSRAGIQTAAWCRARRRRLAVDRPRAGREGAATSPGRRHDGPSRARRVIIRVGSYTAPTTDTTTTDTTTTTPP